MMEWKNMIIFVLTIFTFMIGNLLGLEKSIDNVSENKETKEFKRSLSDLAGFDMNAFARYFPRAYIPSTPAPEDVNCYMEVETTKVVGGRCVNMGRSPIRACQSGIHSEIYHPDCMRTTTQETRTSSPTQST
ncbi:uncharacterized protein LOC133184216 [Saccostrea echinata]|uniref:uncharacterized protein LOC133184216 n=1 Tax=Saccostrea echinata TaxID=191078 RepID=UPI002A83B3C2|nr:uncharacterized protein LOC133184216 [Saccostrea echinata]